VLEHNESKGKEHETTCGRFALARIARLARSRCVHVSE
jgi:hypothetical protein